MRIIGTLLVFGLIGFVAWSTPQLAQEQASQPNQARGNNQGAAARAQLVPTAKAFLNALDEQQKQKALLAYDSDKRVGWHFIPMETRKGLPLREMSEEQKQLAFKLLRATVSQMGYNKATTIMQLESVLRKLEGVGSEDRRDPEKYYFTLFGNPAARQKWGLSIEGHHLSLNFAAEGNRLVGTTPQFFASNPAVLKDSYGEKFPKGMEVLKAEQELAFQLVNSLDQQQLATAMLPGETPSEIRGAGEPQPPTDAPRGIAASEFSDEQLATLKKLMEAYTSKMRPPVAKRRWEQIEEAGLEKVHFSWSGATQPGMGHYYVVQGPTFVIEFINVQPDAAGNPANHIHCVWRDMRGDFGLPIAANN